MKPPRQPGLFDVEERDAHLTDMGDPLVGLKARIDWEAFRPAEILNPFTRIMLRL
jgi:hypothetical protein